MTCPSCGYNRYHFRLPHSGKQMIGPITEKMIIVINLLTDTDFTYPDEPCLTMVFTCAHCGWNFTKSEGVPLQDAFAQAK